jgi:hypothetical protein
MVLLIKSKHSQRRPIANGKVDGNHRDDHDSLESQHAYSVTCAFSWCRSNADNCLCTYSLASINHSMSRTQHRYRHMGSIYFRRALPFGVGTPRPLPPRNLMVALALPPFRAGKSLISRSSSKSPGRSSSSIDTGLLSASAASSHCLVTDMALCLMVESGSSNTSPRCDLRADR